MPLALVALLVVVTWTALTLRGRAEFDALLLARASNAASEAELASLELELARARQDGLELVAAEGPTQRAALLEGARARVRAIDGRARALLEGDDDPRLAATLEPVLEGLEAYAEAVAEHEAALAREPGELELGHARRELESLEAQIAGARALLERRAATIEADLRAQHGRAARDSAIFFGLAFAACVIILLWQVHRARRLERRLRASSASLRGLGEGGSPGGGERALLIEGDDLDGLLGALYAMLDVFEELSLAARAVAVGDLSVEIRGEGELPETFRVMVEGLAAMVAQIRAATLDVASVAQEIHAASLIQEQAAGKQSDGIHEVSVALERLAEAAGHIAGSAGEVLVNAVQTRVHSDEVVAKLGDLGGHTDRIGELLELIREIADRSDLIALNGSLEATRAGEAGRGFGLVASEMRRLAERVTGAVDDVRDTVANVEISSAATTAATRQSRELAENTALVAQAIYGVTEVQNAETKQISTGVRGLATVVSSSASSISQTRAAADGLRERAELLERLTAHFELPGDDDGGGGG